MRPNRLHEKKFRRYILLSLLIIVPLGFLSKFYNGVGAFWVNNSASGVFYEIFWCLFVIYLRPRWKLIWICLAIFLVTSSLEFLQLWHPPFLEVIRSTFIGKILIGTEFVWTDFLYYAIGCILGFLWIEQLLGWCRMDNELRVESG